MKEIRIYRNTFTDKSTIGDLYIDGDLFCVCLERSSRENGEQPLAIPAGRYELEVYASPHFGFDVLRLKDVPGRSEIELHPANYYYQIKGCIAPGTRKDVDCVWDSRRPFYQIMAEAKKSLQIGKLYIEISGGR